MSHKTRRFGDYQRLLTAVSNEVSFNAITPKIERDAEGRIIPVPETRIKLNTVEAVRLLQPYVSVRFMDQFKAVVPLGVYLALFQILFLQQVVEDSWVITGGLFAVIVGLMLFMEGLKLGLMPFGTVIGSTLPNAMTQRQCERLLRIVYQWSGTVPIFAQALRSENGTIPFTRRCCHKSSRVRYHTSTSGTPCWGEGAGPSRAFMLS